MGNRDLFGKLPETQAPDGDKGREERGAFYTPDALALAICNTLRRDLAIIAPHRVFEPGCGGGAFLRAAAVTWPSARTFGVDLVPACDGPGVVSRGDLFDVRSDHFELIIGNPDFGIAEKVVRHCHGLLAAGGYLALLLRITFLGSEGRVPLHREHPLRALQPIAQRPSFIAGGTSDPTEYGLFVWQQGRDRRGELLPPLVWR